MPSKMQTAREIGLAICTKISQKTLKYIEEVDPDLHYDIIQERKKRRSLK